jgi:UDP-N-acetyl-D-mannosaminuronate dehydrogenase
MNLRVAAPNAELEQKLDARTLTVAVIGLGYVGLPLVLASPRQGDRPGH